METEKINQIKYQLLEMVKGFNGYNGEVIADGIRTKLEMSGAIDKPIQMNPKTGTISPQDAEKLLLIATDIFKNSRLSNGDSQ